MMNIQNGLSAHVKPPSCVRDTYKRFRRLDHEELDACPDLLDPREHEGIDNPFLKPADVGRLPVDLQQIFMNLLSTSTEYASLHAYLSGTSGPRVFEFAAVPGLYIYPSLLPPVVQISLLDKLLHRDLSNQEHKTNMHLHHDIPYPKAGCRCDIASYFSASASNLIFSPKNPSIHKPITSRQYLDRKLRWMTLGGQYNWTDKKYPSESPPSFPEDLKELIEHIFPMKAEAAIVNFYSPGDALSLHRDVSEECKEPLVSISLGCDGIFVVGLEGTDESGNSRGVTIRLRSGDALMMSGESRYAWHGVSNILKGTCPESVQDWPFNVLRDQGEPLERFERWKGWMRGKRVNLNVRQMFAGKDDAA